MAEETLIQFPYLEQALQSFGERAVAYYQQELIAKKKNSSYKLAKSLDYIYERDGSTYSVSIKLEDYWKYIEYGIAPAGKYKNPQFKAFPFILEWIKVKPIAPRPFADGKLPTEHQLAYLITRKIANKGIEPVPLLADSVEKAIQGLYVEIEEAISKDLDNITNVMLVNYLAR